MSGPEGRAAMAGTGSTSRRFGRTGVTGNGHPLDSGSRRRLAA
ncbi:hypothetical protein ABT346_04550 [Micromonospora peucetia]